MQRAFVLLAGVAFAASASPGSVSAEQKTQQKTQQSTSGALNPLEFTSGVSVAEQYSDNIFATRTDKISDWITIVDPFANLRLQGDKGEINLGGNASIGRYATHHDENYNDYSTYANGRYNFSPMLSMTGGVAYDHLHEARSSPNARPGVTPTIYDVTRAFGVALMKLDQGSIRVGGTFDRFDYDNVARIGGGTVINDDRDRDMVTVGTRIGYSLNSMDELFGIFTYDTRDYRLPFDDFGFQKDSNGVRFSGGLRHQVSPTLDAEAYFGGIYQRYSDPRFGTVFVPDFGGQVRWTGIPGTTVTARLERTIQETDIEGSSGYLETAAFLNIIHWIRPNLRVDGGASYYLDQFRVTNRVDQVQSFGLGVRNYLTPHFYVGANFSRTTRDSTDLNFSYIESRATVRAGLVQEPAYKNEDFKKPEVPADSQGRFYIGIQTGISNLETKLEGPRGNNGTLQADFGDEGWSNGLFAGYGRYIGDWYLGLEADVSKATGGWDHAHVPGERIFAVSRDYEYGLSGIIGRSFKGGTMLYGKAGVVAAQFETDYQLRERGTQDRRTEGGIRVGVGVSAPIAHDVAVRLEHTYSAFDSYNIDCCISPPGGPPDNFANNETITSVGLVYTFGGVPGAMMPANMDYRGVYVGGQVGHDALSTLTTGPREAGTTLTAVFGDLGYTAGLFAGYGAQFGNLYMGGELEAELGKTHGNHQREGGGRSFAVEKQWSYGASLRAGYVVNDTALLYARIGVVGARFQVDFSRGSNRLAAQYNETGIRYGGGMEIPISNNFIARLDYTHTSYPEFSLVTPPNGEIEQFHPKEDLFRVGVLHKFGSN